METDSTLTGAPASMETSRKVVATHEGDEGNTSLGIHGFVPKEDARIELLGGLDLLKTYANTLPHAPPWLNDMLTDMMVTLVKPIDIRHEERLKFIDDGITDMRDQVSFSASGWFTPTTPDAKQWDVFRVFVRQVERDAWRAYVLNEKKERFKEIAQLLNRLSDYSFLMSMMHEQRKL